MGVWFKRITTNWSTSIPAAIVAICAATGLSEILPPEYFKYLMATCGFFTAIGLFAAKSSNVSNAPVPAASAVVSKTSEARTNPTAEAAAKKG